MRNLLVAVLILQALACSSKPKGPDAQAQFVQQWRSIRSDWETADSKSNDLQKSQVEAKARELFTSKTEVTDWTGEVDKVATVLGSASVYVKQDGVTYILFPEGDAPPIFGSIQQGDRVRFSGTRVNELSVTMSGGIREPEMSIKPLKTIQQL